MQNTSKNAVPAPRRLAQETCFETGFEIRFGLRLDPVIATYERGG